MNLNGAHYIKNVGLVNVQVELKDVEFEDSEGPGIDMKVGNGQELHFQCTDVCNPDEYPQAKQGISVITFSGSEYVGDVVRRFMEYKASKAS